MVKGWTLQWHLMSIIPSTLLLVVVVVIAVSVVRASRMPHAINNGAACGECGYGFSGWSTCPECGKTASHAGVLTPALWTKFRADPSGVVIGWILLGFVVSNAVTTSIESAAAQAGYRAMGAEQTGWGTDAEGARFELVLAAEGLTRHGVLQDGTIGITVSRTEDGGDNSLPLNTTRVASASLDVASGTARIFDGDRREVGRFNGLTTEAVTLLYRTGGLSGAVEAIWPTAMSLSDALRDGRIDWNTVTIPFKVGSNSSHHSSRTLPFSIFGKYGQFYEEAITLFVLAIAGLGIRWSLRCRVRAFAFAAKRSAPSPNR